MKHEEGELKKKQADLKSTAKGYEKDKIAFEAMKKDLSKIEVCKFVSSQCNLNKMQFEQNIFVIMCVLYCKIS